MSRSGSMGQPLMEVGPARFLSLTIKAVLGRLSSHSLEVALAHSLGALTRSTLPSRLMLPRERRYMHGIPT